MSIFGPPSRKTADIDARLEKVRTEMSQSTDDAMAKINRRFAEMSRVIGDTVSKMARLPLVTVWAENRGRLISGRYEWSFGNHANNRYSGYTMAMPGRILRIGLCSVDKDGHATIDEIRVNLVLNGDEQPEGISMPGGRRSAFRIFNPPIEVRAGSVINFVTKVGDAASSASVVTLIIELTDVI